MKRFFSILFVMLVSLYSFAQNDVTKFLGIPVDGTEAQMRSKLLAKGFKVNEYDKDALSGQFNGESVEVFVVTNNNKVYRIMVADKDTRDEANIRIRFNRLIDQFNRNERYVPLDNNPISEDEDISYEMTVRNKIYEATFFQTIDMEKVDSLSMFQMVAEEVVNNYTEDELKALGEEKVKEIFEQAAVAVYMKKAAMKSVWFRISRYGSKFYIVMYYDNRYNMADGEDL